MVTVPTAAGDSKPKRNKKPRSRRRKKPKQQVESSPDLNTTPPQPLTLEQKLCNLENRVDKSHEYSVVPSYTTILQLGGVSMVPVGLLFVVKEIWLINKLVHLCMCIWALWLAWLFRIMWKVW